MVGPRLVLLIIGNYSAMSDAIQLISVFNSFHKRGCGNIMAACFRSNSNVGLADFSDHLNKCTMPAAPRIWV